MTPQAKRDVLNYLDQLRQEYKGADEDGKLSVIEHIEEIKEKYKLVKCRLDECKRLMFNDPADPNWPFHGAQCHKIWADANYGPLPEPKKQPSLDALRKRIAERAKQEQLNKHL